MKIKTGDKVRVLAGKDKGKEGNVLQVFPELSRVVVEGVNTATKHLRGRGREIKGQKITFPSPIHISNVALIGKSGTSGRVGYKRIEKDGKTKKIRVLRVSGKAGSGSAGKGAVEDIE